MKRHEGHKRIGALPYGLNVLTSEKVAYSESGKLIGALGIGDRFAYWLKVRRLGRIVENEPIQDQTVSGYSDSDYRAPRKCEVGRARK